MSPLLALASHPWPAGVAGHVAALVGAVTSDTIVTMSPQSAGLPGGDELQNLVDGAGWWALAASLVAMLIGAAAWALGAHSHNYQQTITGRRAVLVSGLAALLIGAGPAIVNFFYSAGQTVPGH